MNPAQLLNPRAFKKEQGKKKAPNYGPKQSRKPAVPSSSDVMVNTPTYDPKILLAPKGAGARMATNQSAPPAETLDVNGSPTTIDNEQRDSNATSLYEQHHHVTKRQAPTATKRKADDNVDDDDDDRKKQKPDFGVVARGGVLSDHMRKEREALNADVSTTIDLTEDGRDDDVEVIGSNQDVCLGEITVNVHCDTVPHVNNNVAARLGGTHWPVTKVHLSVPHQSGQHIIEVKDRTRMSFGKMASPEAKLLIQLITNDRFTNFRAVAFLQMRQRRAGEEVGAPISRMHSMTLTLYALRSKADMIGAYLKSHKLDLRDPVKIEPGIPLYNPHKRTVNGLPDHRPFKVNGIVPRPPNGPHNTNVVHRTMEEMKREVDTMFDGLMESEIPSEMEADDKFITTELQSHQKQALRFMVDHEEHDFSTSEGLGFSLWKPVDQDKNKEAWYNVITSIQQTTKPEPTRGGILADMMGLGKSLSILSLIAATNETSKKFGPRPVPSNIKALGGVNSRATLIVCPTSVVASWEEQLKLHTVPGKMKCVVYHGTGRTRDEKKLANHHIILTSYGTLRADFNASAQHKRTLFRINWFRVVLDEAHQIRNATTNSAKACYELTADRRWAVTGTPVQNRLDDLAALIKYLRVKPFDDPAAWAQYINAPFKTGNADVLQHLSLLVASVTLRRKKDTISLPKRVERNVRLEFSKEEQLLYSAFSSQSNLKMQALFREDKIRGNKGMAHVLKTLGRLRMICDHGRELISKEDMEEVKGFDEAYAIDLGDDPELDTTASFMKESQAYDLFQMLLDGGVIECAECGKALVDANTLGDETPYDSEDEDESDVEEGRARSRGKKSKSADLLGYLTPCYHLFHPGCKEEHEHATPVATDGYHDCPDCGTYVRNQFVELTRSGFRLFLADKMARSRRDKKKNIDPETYAPSTKVRALIEELLASAGETRQLPEGEPPIRSVVFTEWTSFLDLIEYGLEEVGIPHLRLDGSLSLKARKEVLTKFKSDPDSTVLLVSIKAGGQGLNLTAANKVYLMEPQYNPGVEQQAVDRVHRLGQLREVEITHFLMSNTVEEGMLKLQEKKMKLAQLGFDRKRKSTDDAKAFLAECRELFK